MPAPRNEPAAVDAFTTHRLNELVMAYERTREAAAHATLADFAPLQEEFRRAGHRLAYALRRHGKAFRRGDWFYGCDRHAIELTRSPAPSTRGWVK